MSLNKVTLIGNLTQDPVKEELPGGKKVARFGLATHLSWKDVKTGERKQSTEFHDLVAWDRLADICDQYLTKGSKVYVEGRLRKQASKDKQGRKSFHTEVVVENLIMLGHRRRPEPEKPEIASEDLPK